MICITLVEVENRAVRLVFLGLLQTFAARFCFPIELNMNATRLKNFSFGFMLLTVFTVWRATHDKPMQTSKLVVALVLSFAAYGLISWAKRLETSKGGVPSDNDLDKNSSSNKKDLDS